MKPLDKKDLPKLYALIGLSVLAVGYGVFTLATSSAVAQGPVKPPDGGAVQASAVPAPAPTPAPESMESILAAVTGPGGGRDPFTPLAGGPGTGVVAIATPTKPVGPLPGPRPGFGAAPGGFGGFNPSGPGAGSLPGPTTAPVKIVIPPPPTPQFGVTGVVIAEQDGGQSVAILRGGESERRYVRVGDPVGNGFVVSSIGLEGVEIVDSQRDRAVEGPFRRVVVKVSK